MNRLFALAVLAFTVLVLPARAQTPDEQYVRIYNLIQQADSMNKAEQAAPALAKYLDAQSALQNLQRRYPDWNPKVVSFRLNYLSAKIAAVTAKTPAPQPVAPAVQPAPATTPAPPKPSGATEAERQVSALQEEVRALQSDKSLLEAKLKEALATQPAAIDPRELTKAAERIKALLKENDLLKASLAEELAKPARGADPKALEETKVALADANRKLAEQTERANKLATEKQVLQERVITLSGAAESVAALDATKKALEEANRKLAGQTELASKLTQEKGALESRVRTLTTSAEAADALRAENALLKRQLTDAKSAAPVAGASGDSARQLAQAQAQIAALQSDAEILRLEKIALQNRVRQMNAAPVTTTAIPSAVRPEDAERIKQLERERDDLQKKLDSANKELFGRKGKEVAARIDELSSEIATLRARLGVFEARAVPYTAEELALFKQSTTVLAAADPNAGKKSVKELPAGTAALAAEAQRHFNAKQFDRAEEKYLEILRQDDKNAYSLANLAAIQLELNHLDEAEKHVKQALAVSPEDGYALSLLGYVKYRQEKYDEALDALSRAAKVNPQSAEIQNYLGVTLSHKGMRGPAETALRKAIQLDPAYGSAHNNLAVIYLTQNPPLVELARWHYQKARAAGHPANAELEKMLEDKAATAK